MERSVKPESIAIGVFGAIAALAALAMRRSRSLASCAPRMKKVKYCERSASPLRRAYRRPCRGPRRCGYRHRAGGDRRRGTLSALSARPDTAGLSPTRNRLRLDGPRSGVLVLIGGLGAIATRSPTKVLPIAKPLGHARAFPRQSRAVHLARRDGPPGLDRDRSPIRPHLRAGSKTRSPHAPRSSSVRPWRSRW